MDQFGVPGPRLRTEFLSWYIITQPHNLVANVVDFELAFGEAMQLRDFWAELLVDIHARVQGSNPLSVH